jgi:hypothetical protein
MTHDDTKNHLRTLVRAAREVLEEEGIEPSPTAVGACVLAAAVQGLYVGALAPAPLEAIAIALGGDQIQSSVADGLHHLADVLTPVSS